MWWGASVPMLVLAQALHGVTFGVFWLAVVRLVNAITPRDLSSTGQSLLSTAGRRNRCGGGNVWGWLDGREI